MVQTSDRLRSAEANNKAAQILFAARKAGQRLAGLPPSLRPDDLESGLVIQNRISAALDAEGDSIIGWKCASPTPEKIIAAPIYRSALYTESNGMTIAVTGLGGNAVNEVKVEPEVAFVLGRDLPARDVPYGVDAIDHAIAEVRLALEIIGSRYLDPAQVSFPELLADGLLNSGVVLGPRVDADFRALPTAIELGLRIEGQPDQTLHGLHPEKQCVAPLYWLTNFLNQRGISLRAGQSIITGSYAGVLALPVNRTIQIRFGALGTITTIFQAG
jgi:2-keto-4-pentenoate hydratase